MSTLQLLFSGLAIVALVIGVQAVFRLRDPARATDRRTLPALAILAIVVAALVGTGFALQQREIREARLESERARAEAQARQARSVAVTLSTAQKLQQPLLYTQPFEQLMRENESRVLRLLDSDALGEARILWVEGVKAPSSGVLERVVFETMGLAVDTASTNKTALDRIEEFQYDLIVTDQFRLGDSDTAAYALLSELKRRTSAIQVIIYDDVGVDAPSGSARGAAGVTADPGELFSRVVSILTSRRTDGR